MALYSLGLGVLLGDKLVLYPQYELSIIFAGPVLDNSLSPDCKLLSSFPFGLNKPSLFLTTAVG